MMRLFSFVIAGLATFAFSATASAALILDVTSDVTLVDLAPGDQFTLSIDVGTTTDGEAQGLTLRAGGWGSELSFVSATAPNSTPGAAAGGALFGAPAALVIPGVGTFNTYQNSITNVNSAAVDNGDNVVLFNGVTTGSTTGGASTADEIFTITLQVNAGYNFRKTRKRKLLGAILCMDHFN
jgi:hypothetical protein